MKKILLYIETLRRGGAERVMSEIANYLVSRSYSVLLVNNPHDSDEIEQYSVDERVRRIYLDEYYKKSNNSLIRTFRRICALRKICKKEKIDVGLSFLGNGNIRFLLATYGLKLKKFVSVRNSPDKEYCGKKMLAKILFNKSDGVIFQTEDAKKWFTKSVQKKSKVILNPVNNCFFETNWQPEKDVTSEYIVTTGRLVKQKNHELLIKAFAKFHTTNPAVKLYIYGNDFGSGSESRKRKLETLVKDLNLEDCIFLPGNVKNVPEVLSHARAFVLSSDYEGLPNALMEAMAVGLPCISTNCPCGGPATLITNNENGILIPVCNEKALADAINNVFSDSEFAQTIGKKAKISADVFKTETVMKQWEEYLLK